MGANVFERQMNTLVSLAIRDAEIEKKEVDFIQKVGLANGFTAQEVEHMLYSPQEEKNFESLTNDERFEYLFYLIKLMKADYKVFKSEIEFCKKMAEKLGYNRGVVIEMSAHVYSNPDISVDRKVLMDIANRFIKK